MNGIIFQQAPGTSRGLHFSLSRLALSCSGLGSGSRPPGHASCLPSAAPPLLATGLFGDLCPISKAPRRGRQSQLQAGGSNAHRIPRKADKAPASSPGIWELWGSSCSTRPGPAASTPLETRLSSSKPAPAAALGMIIRASTPAAAPEGCLQPP